MPEITQIRTESDYEAALARITELIHSAPGSAEDAELDRISDLVIEYEDVHYPMEDPEPSSLIEFLIDQLIVSRERMEALAGGSDLLDAMMAGRTPITAEVAQVLHEHTGLSMKYLMADPLPSQVTAASN